MRIISFQSKSVLDILMTGQTYFADAAQCREKRDYSLDCEQLAGKHPVWGFCREDRQPFLPIDFLYPVLLEKFRNEISLEEDGLYTKIMLHLEVPDDLVRVGLTHNAYDCAVVFPRIEPSWLLSHDVIIQCWDHFYARYPKHLLRFYTPQSSELTADILQPLLDIFHDAGKPCTIVPGFNRLWIKSVTENVERLASIDINDRAVKANVLTKLTSNSLDKLEGTFRILADKLQASFLSIDNGSHT